MMALCSFKMRTTHLTKQHHIAEVLDCQMTNNLSVLNTCKFSDIVADVYQRTVLWDHKFVSTFRWNVLPPFSR
jgi:hypothetical protein